MSRLNSSFFRKNIFLLVILLVVVPFDTAYSEDDPFPGVSDGAEVSARQPINPRTGDPADGSAPINCPNGSGRSQVANATTKEQYLVCVKNWRPTATINADKDFRDRQEAARAAAEAESKAWNAANPGKQKCVQWGPIVHANGVSTASGGVCANPVEPGPNATVPTQSAPSVEAPAATSNSSTSSTNSGNSSTSTIGSENSTSSTSSSTGSTTGSNSTSGTSTTSSNSVTSSSPAEDYSKWGSGTPYTRVLKGQLSTSDCPSGFQAANGIIVAIGSGTFTECWPENAWSAYRLGGSVWEQFKNSGGTYDAKAELDRRNKVVELRALAKSVAQTAADQTPGIQRCSKWSGYGESGEECAYTFVQPTGISGNTGSSNTTTDTGTSTTTQGTTTATSSTAPTSNTTNTSSENQINDPFPNLKNGEEIPGTRITSSSGITQSDWEQSSTYKSHNCPPGSGRAGGVDLNFTVTQTDDRWFTYCVKSYQSTTQNKNTTSSSSESSTVSSSTSTNSISTNSNAIGQETTTATQTSASETNTVSTTSKTSSETKEEKKSGESQNTSTNSAPNIESTSIEVNGSITEIKNLVTKVVEDKKEARAISTLISRVDSSVSKTSLKQLKLPGSLSIDEVAESKTPEICSVNGLTINSLKKGTCVVAYTVTDSDGNKFTTDKEIYFRK